MSASPAPPKATGKGPLIPEKYLDAPSQRLYYLSLGLLCQAIKVVDLLYYITSDDDTLRLCKKWLVVDLAYCLVLSRLRIPRLRYSISVVVLQILSLWFLNGLMFGGLSLNLGTFRHHEATAGHSVRGDILSTPQTYGIMDWLGPLTFGALTSSYSGNSDSHLLGQHTVRMSPISTAQLNPSGTSFCLSSSQDAALVPILLNNTTPTSLRYSISTLEGLRTEYIDVSAKELRAIEQHRVASLQLVKAGPTSNADEDYDEYDDDDDGDDSEKQIIHSSLQRTQALMHVRLARPGLMRLERVVDASGIEARLQYPWEVLITECPRVHFVDDPASAEIRCAGQDADHELMIDISGVTPLSLRWFKMVNGKRENFLVEGIEKELDPKDPMSDGEGHLGARRRLAYQSLNVPLSVSTSVVGTHVYALEEVADAVGNVVRVGADMPSVESKTHATTTTRSFQVLRRSSVSFRHCGPGQPTAIRIGGEAALTITANEADNFDLPLEITIKYSPHPLSEGEHPGSKHDKPWTKTLSTEGNRRDLSLLVSAPGQYAIDKVKGKWCSGDVLAPETCEVVERPLPSAEIEWKKIHECSGDTGVSAALVMHGTPPFHVHYRVQRDNEPVKDLQKQFGNSRGELTLQPERSGHYVFSFLHISDANYKRVALDGPSIDQIIHSPASADFVTDVGARNKRRMSSCEGDAVDVEVELKGSGPWNLEVQVVGPKSTQTILVENIETYRKTISVPIPKKVDQEGGNFEIDLVSVEDKYRCKRPVSVPGIIVNVRRVKPTVKFYGENEKRHVTVLENEEANLPLRLTGDGPWKVRYHRLEMPKQIFTAKLDTPNAILVVRDKGMYELIDINDAQCPGSIVPEGSTYRVDWIPRPFATLARHTEATYEPYNGSHILPPICEGSTDHVDLDLKGKPPFEIMYNIAQNSENGGTKLIDQPTFSSIQPHTRLQLQTLNPGRVYYEVKQIGDASYPLAKHRNAVIPRSERLLFEQQVLMRPSAHFKNRNRLPYCLNDAFTPVDLLSSDGTIIFEGTPPFKLRLVIKNVASSLVDTRTIETYSSIWKVDLPSYTFQAVGPHLIIVDSVSDASGCDHASLDPLQTTIWVDVAETAAILPFDRREDYCVGDVAQFQLEGIPPWSINYKINGRAQSQEAKVSPFSLAQLQPGEFAITSISHQQKMCKAVVTDLRFTVHPLPSAQVGHGKRIYQDIHEGDQAEIVFTLIGEPPFTFTYQRSEPIDKKGGKSNKVLETHTVSRIHSHEYSIFSALEGTWTVTSISDRYCRYPPAQPEASMEKRR